MPKQPELLIEDATFGEIVLQFCLRPQKYLSGGTFEEAAAWLHASNLALHKRFPDDKTELDRYEEWASQTYEVPSAKSYLQIIAEEHPDDVSRFRQLRLTFSKFARFEAVKCSQNKEN